MAKKRESRSERQKAVEWKRESRSERQKAVEWK